MSGAIDLQVDELILHGLHVPDRYALGDALSRELTNLFETGSNNLVFGYTAQIPTVQADRVTIASEARPTVIGAQIARSVYRSLNFSNEKGGSR